MTWSVSPLKRPRTGVRCGTSYPSRPRGCYPRPGPLPLPRPRGCRGARGSRPKPRSPRPSTRPAGSNPRRTPRAPAAARRGGARPCRPRSWPPRGARRVDPPPPRSRLARRADPPPPPKPPAPDPPRYALPVPREREPAQLAGPHRDHERERSLVEPEILGGSGIEHLPHPAGAHALQSVPVTVSGGDRPAVEGVGVAGERVEERKVLLFYEALLGGAAGAGLADPARPGRGEARQAHLGEQGSYLPRSHPEIPRRRLGDEQQPANRDGAEIGGRVRRGDGGPAEVSPRGDRAEGALEAWEPGCPRDTLEGQVGTALVWGVEHHFRSLTLPAPLVLGRMLDHPGHRGSYSRTTRGSPGRTVLPVSTRTFATLPLLCARISLSIFIASRMHRCSSAATSWPSAARTLTIVHCIGATTAPPPIAGRRVTPPLRRTGGPCSRPSLCFP